MTGGVVLVTGATGTVGREVVRQLSQAGLEVRAAVRPSSLPAWSDGGSGLGKTVSAAPFDFADPRGFRCGA